MPFTREEIEALARRLFEESIQREQLVQVALDAAARNDTVLMRALARTSERDRRFFPISPRAQNNQLPRTDGNGDPLFEEQTEYMSPQQLDAMMSAPIRAQIVEMNEEARQRAQEERDGMVVHYDRAGTPPAHLLIPRGTIYVAPNGGAWITLPNGNGLALAPNQSFSGDLTDATINERVLEPSNAVRTRTVRIIYDERRDLPDENVTRHTFPMADWRGIYGSLDDGTSIQNALAPETMRALFEVTGTRTLSLNRDRTRAVGYARRSLEKAFHDWLGGRVVYAWFMEPCFEDNYDPVTDIRSVKFFAAGWFDTQVPRGSKTIEVVL